MVLRGIDFGSVWGHSGVQGFFGEGYWYHKILWWFGLRFKGMTFVAKTTTLEQRDGNMPMKEDGITSLRLFPKCVVVRLRKGAVLNAVGLSGPGLRGLLRFRKWQIRTEPFFISFMAVKKTRDERLLEVREFARILRMFLPVFNARIGVMINVSCPNAGVSYGTENDFISEIWNVLDILSGLRVPIVMKFSLTTRPEVVKKLELHSAYDATCVSNTVPWGKFPDKIDWEGLFGSKESPLAKFGGGGLSGFVLLPLLEDWLNDAAKCGLEKPIAAGGGILQKKDVHRVLEAGQELVQAICIGSVTILRGWRTQGVISEAIKAVSNQPVREKVVGG